MMMCPVCLGAFSWKEDLLHHFGAVHHLEELVAHLESEEFSGDTTTCPPCCRVPETLFKNLLPDSARRSTLSPASVSDTAEENKYSANTEAKSPVHDVHADDRRIISAGNVDVHGGAKKSEGRGSPRHANVDDGTKSRSESCSLPPQHSLSDDCIRSIERYHCDLCEFSANDIRQLDEHCSSEHCYQNTPPPATPTPDELSEALSNDAADNGSPSEQAKGAFFCDSCPYVAKCRLHIQRHMDTHRRSALVKVGYKCGYCNMASAGRGSIRMHVHSCHSDQPLKILRIDDGKVVEGDSISADSPMSKTAKSSPSSSSRSPGPAPKKQRSESKSPKSKVAAVRHNSCISVSKKQLDSTSSSNTDERPSSSREASAEALVRKLPPGRMIYWQPVRCPLCDFSSSARVNLVRHIRLIHGGDSQQSLTTTTPSAVTSVNRDNVVDKSSSEPVQV